MTTYYFDTGVRFPGNHTNPPPRLYGKQVVRGGNVQIPFTCDGVPDNAIFRFASDSPDADRSGKLHRAEITDHKEPGGLRSKYAYFLVY